MNFNQWFNKNPYSYPAGKPDMLMGWEACKKEILKVIANNTPAPICGSMQEFKLHSTITNIVKEIEKL